jgi:hypothetical protein
VNRVVVLRLLPTLALCAAGGCLLYSDHINRAPESLHINTPTGHTRNMPITFTATASDPDQGVLSFDWSTSDLTVSTDCPATPTRDAMPPTTYTGSSFQVTPTELNHFCVWVIVSDTDGASTGPATLTAHADNSPPQVALLRQQPSGNALVEFPLYTDFRFSAANSRDIDGDQLSRTWDLVGFPDLSLAAMRSFNDHCAPSDPTDMAACFHADAPGGYQIAVTVADGVDAATQSVAVAVAGDAPPCLLAAGTDLPARSANPAEPQMFSVAVVDDGDPWPPANPSYGAPGFPTFTWKIRRNDGAWQSIAGTNRSTLDLVPGELSVGDHAEIRVEVSDRVPRSLGACGDNPTCAQVPNCAQRVTWTVNFQ